MVSSKSRGFVYLPRGALGNLGLYTVCVQFTWQQSWESLPPLCRPGQTSGVGSTRDISHPSEKEKIRAVHNATTPFSRVAFLEGHGFGWRANNSTQPNVNQLEIQTLITYILFGTCNVLSRRHPGFRSAGAAASVHVRNILSRNARDTLRLYESENEDVAGITVFIETSTECKQCSPVRVGLESSPLATSNVCSKKPFRNQLLSSGSSISSDDKHALADKLERSPRPSLTPDRSGSGGLPGEDCAASRGF
jgi:hypothetical protein